MSSRALRKAQREQEEELARKLQEEEDAGDGEEFIQPQAKMSAFAMLAETEDDDDEDSGGIALDEEEGHKQDEDQDVHIVAATQQASIPKASGKKKKKKKQKAKRPKSSDITIHSGSDIDEIDEALKQLATEPHSAQSGTTSGGVQDTLNASNRLLAIDTAHLHAQNEMRRLFGRAALEHDEQEEAVQGNIGGNRRQQRRVQHAGLAQALRGGAGRSNGLASLALRKNIFVQGKESWPLATGGGLGMEVEEKRADGTWLYRFVHNTAYQDVQGQFEACVESMDPQRMVVLLQHNPYHISTLLQVSEIAKSERDNTTAGDLLERALFSFGRALHSTFSRNLSEGKARLDFARPENREFWLAAWRYMQNLSMRGTWRTVYEWAKLLLSLGPEEDPYALWLVLDQYALRARQDLDYLNISRSPAFKDGHKNMPNVQLSQSLADYRSGNKSKGQQALFTAVGRFPWVVARLMQELTVDPPPAVWGKEPRTDQEKLYSEMYATRAKDIWNTPEHVNFLVEVTSALPAETPSAPIAEARITREEARHVLLSDTPALIALIPRHFSAAMSSASDPLPPTNSTTSYATHRPDRRQGSRAAGETTGTRRENLVELESLLRFFGLSSTEASSQEQLDRTMEEQSARVGADVVAERFQRLVDLGAGMLGSASRNGAQMDGEDGELTEEERARMERLLRGEDVVDDE